MKYEIIMLIVVSAASAGACASPGASTAAGGQAPAPPPAGPPSPLARVNVMPDGPLALAAFRPLIAASDTARGHCTLERTLGSSATAARVSYPGPPRGTTTLTFDSAQTLVRYLEERGTPLVSLPAGLSGPARDSAVGAALMSAQLTSIELDFPSDAGTLMNRSGLGVIQRATGTVSDAERLPQLGDIRARIAHVRRICGL